MKHLRFLTLLLLAALTFGSVWADDPDYRDQRREIFRQLPVNENSIVFLGNSITDFGLWSEFFGSDPNIINRGIQGIESPEVLEHLSLIGSGHPKKVFLMIGINDFKTPERVVPNIRKMLETLQRESPQTTLYVQSILPCNIAERASEPGTLNPQIKALCEEMNVTYIDVYGAMTKISGNTSMPANMTEDSLHPNVLGYREWCKVLASYVGKSSVIAETGTVKKPLNRGIYNSILSEYQLVPVNNGDILHVGDYQVMTGEWAELMGMSTFKNRGLGGGFGWSMSLAEFNSAYGCLIKGSPSKIFFQCGKRALDAKETTAASLFSQYKTAVNNIRKTAPDADLYLESIIPNADASINTSHIVPFNNMIKDLVNGDATGKLHFVDVYAALVENGKLAARYQGANTVQSRGINGRGYVAWANVLKNEGGLTDAVVPANMSDAKAALNEAVHNALDKVWALSGEKACAGLRQRISEAQAIIADAAASDIDCTAMKTLLAEAAEASENASPTSADAMPGSTHLLPAPQKLEKNGSAFALDRPVKIDNAFDDTELLTEILQELGLEESATATATVKVNKVSRIAGADEPTLAGFESEAYTLSIAGNTITIDAVSRLGVIRAAQTLQQLAEADGGHTATLEGLTITDWPAFKVRGFMHDVGRSFITYDELVKQIKLYSRFKVNFFQWHMTENQAWRFQVKAYPQLTATQNMTRFAGQYYTQEQCKAIDALGHKYGIYVVPEIDMPGHSEAFKTAMGHDMQTSQGVKELRAVLDEVIECFPHAPYIHIGGDEVDLKNVDGKNFLVLMSEYVHGKGQRTMWWNPVHTISPSKANGCDMAQCWSSSGRQNSGLPCIDCRYNYTNHFDVFADLVGMYRSTILYKQHGDAETAGYISCPWNDRKTPTQEDIFAQNNVYAVTIASGERAWRGGGKHYIEECGAVLPNSGDEYDEFRDWEQRFLFHKAHSLNDEPIPYVKQTNVRWRISDPISNGGDANKTFAQWEDCKAQTAEMPASVTVDGNKYGWNLATGAGIYLNHTWPTAVPGIFGLNQAKDRTAYAYTYVYNPGDERTVGALIEFQNYGRSEKDQAPAAGKWDHKGSKVWWNGTEVKAPNWKNAGKGINNEVDLLDENFPARTPVQLTLKKGWNKVLIKLPYVNLNSSVVRLNKWLYTFVLTDTQGKNAIEGLTYSPTKTLEGEEPDPAQEEDNTPLVSDEHTSYYYSLKTPGRDNRYASSQGANAEMTGVASPTNASYWKFVRRADGDLDIVNYADGTFVSPVANYDSPLHTQSSSPEQGWKLKPAATKGYFIIVSGETEWNQTKAEQNYKIYNWGYGSKTTGEYNYDDGGCQYEILINEDLTEDSYEYVGVEPGKTYTITNIQKNGSQFPLYVDSSNTLCIGLSGQNYGESAQFQVEGHQGKVAFKNVATGQYLVWRDKNGNGTNSNKGTLGTYNSTYCDWTLAASVYSPGNYWMWTYRGNGSTPGALMIKNDRSWDAFSNTEGWLDAYSNVYKFEVVGAPAEEVEALQDKIDAILPGIQAGKIGYPRLENTDVQELLGLKTVTPQNYDDAKAAYDKVMALGDVNLPVSGKAYTIAIRKSDGTKNWYIKGTGFTSSAADADIFVCGKAASGEFPYVFVTNENKFLTSRGVNTAEAYTAKVNDFKAEAMVGHSSTFISSTYPTFGTICLTAQGRNGNLNSTGTIILKEATSGYDNSSAPYLNGQFTSALIVEETSYPYNNVELKKASTSDTEAYATVYLPFDMQVPAGIEVYKATEERDVNNKTYLKLARVNTENGPVAKGAYVLYSESVEGKNVIVPTATKLTAGTDNLLIGSTAQSAQRSALKNPYVLAYKGTPVAAGFYRYTADVYPLGRAIYDDSTSQANCFNFDFGNIVDAISTLRSEGTDSILIDLSGRRVNNNTKGIVIKNNRKAVIK